jgi:hypothetical protein
MQPRHRNRIGLYVELDRNSDKLQIPNTTEKQALDLRLLALAIILAFGLILMHMSWHDRNK